MNSDNEDSLDKLARLLKRSSFETVKQDYDKMWRTGLNLETLRAMLRTHHWRFEEFMEANNERDKQLRLERAQQRI